MVLALCWEVCQNGHAESLQEPLFVIQGIQLLHKAKLPKADPSQSAQLSLHASGLHQIRKSQQRMIWRAAAFALAMSIAAGFVAASIK